MFLSVEAVSFQTLEVPFGRDSSYQTSQFGFLDTSAGNILGQVELAIRVYFLAMPQVSLEVLGAEE